jgi:hypothetical protein
MNVGTTRHHVTLDGPGGLPLEPPDWWCAVDEVTGQTTITGRFHPGITTATRVHHKGRIYHVESLTNREDLNTELVLMCREVFDGEVVL